MANLSPQPEIKRAQQELLDCLPSATILIRGTEIYLNPKAEQITGYSNGDFSNVEEWFRVVYGSDSLKIKGFYEADRKTNFSEKRRIPFLTKNRGQRIFEFTAKKNSSENQVLETWHLEDITESLLTEQRFSVLFNHSTDPHLLFDETGIVDCNQATVKILNAKSKDQILSAHPAVFSPELQPCGLRSLEKNKIMDSLAQRNGYHRFEWLHKKLTGEEFLVEVTLNPVQVADKMMLLVVWHDLTESRQAQSVLLNTAKMATLGEMAANIAHEINNPLAIIAGKATQLKRALEKTQGIEGRLLEDAEKIVKTTMRIARTVDGLRSFARDASLDPLVETSLKKCIDESIELCSERIKTNNVELKILYSGVEESDLAIAARGTQISQVIVNLISNAFDAINECSVKWIHLKVEKDQNFVRVRVVDSGSGIPSHVLENMMRPFFTTKGVGKGTGLGLSISRSIIEAHHGQLYYDSHYGSTCFVIEVPIYQTAELRRSAS